MSEANVPKCPIMSQEPELSPEHLQAIQMLIVGKSNTEVAQALDKDRRTIYRWLQNPHFMAELNQQRKELYESGQLRVHGLMHKAIGVLEQQLDEGSLRAAMEILKMLDVSAKTLKADFQTNPEAIAAREAERMAWQAYTAIPFARDNVGIGARQDKGLHALANDIFEIVKEKYKVTAEVEELLE